jgi:hypothetical protein
MRAGFMSRLRQARAKSVTIPNSTIRDKSLSLKAKGFLALLLSFDDDWDFRFDHLVTLSNDGREGTRSAMKELEDKKYLVKTPARDEVTRHFTGWDWIVSDVPMVDDDTQDKESIPNDQDTDIRETDIRLSDIRVSRPSAPTEDNKNTNSKNTKKEYQERIELEIPETLKNKSGFLAAWDEWQKHKKAKRQTLTEFAIRKQLKFLESQPDPVACIEQAILRNWSGIFEVKSSNATPSNLTPPTPPKSTKPLWEQEKVSSVQFFYHPDYGKMFRLAASATYGDHFAPDTTLDFMDADCTKRLVTLRADVPGLEVWNESRHAAN